MQILLPQYLNCVSVVNHPPAKYTMFELHRGVGMADTHQGWIGTPNNPIIQFLPIK